MCKFVSSAIQRTSEHFRFDYSFLTLTQRAAMIWIHLTICNIAKHQCVSKQSKPAFAQSHSQSQARLMFVTALEIDNLDCTTQSDSHIKKFSLPMGGAYSRVDASVTSPTSPPYVAKQPVSQTTTVDVSCMFTAMQHQQ